MVNDCERLKSILINLLDNAFKYTIFGKILVVISQIDSNLMEIKISDTGLGINPQKCDKL